MKKLSDFQSSLTITEDTDSEELLPNTPQTQYQRICEGLRPNLEKVVAPRLLKDLISRCWDAHPEQRPTAGELYGVLRDWLDRDFLIRKNTEFYHQYQELLTTKSLDSLTNKPPMNCPSDKYTSRRLDFPNLSQPQNSKELNEKF